MYYHSPTYLAYIFKIAIATFFLIHTYIVYAVCPTNDVSIVIENDAYGEDIFWSLTPTGNACGVGEIANGGNPNLNCNSGGQPATAGFTDPYPDNTNITEGPYALSVGDSYDFHLIDDWGDGITLGANATNPDIRIQQNGLDTNTYNVTGSGGVFTFTVIPSLLTCDTTPPDITSTNFTNNALLPGGNHDVVIEYSDTDSGIDISSADFQLFKWDGISSYGPDIASTNSTAGVISATQANYTLDNLSLGKYQYIFSISDTAGNTSSETIEFYIDVPEFTVSDQVIDIGDIGSIANSYSNTVTLTVKTIGAAFDLTTNMPIPDLIYTPDLITPWNGTHGFGFALAPYSSITAIGTNQILFSESKNINSNGNLNTYTYDLKLGALSELLQAAGEYEGFIDFGIEFQY